jgi:hypothetical protein
MAVWLRTVLIALLTFAIYWGSAAVFEHTETPDVAYFNHLAAAFLQGRTYLVAPPATHDLTAYEGRWYVPFPPLPALLMLPWVWVAGLAGVNTVFFCAFLGALNVALIQLVLTALSQRGWSRLGAGDNLWLTALLGLGSVHWYMATIGSVWFVAQICTVTFVALAVWIAIAAPLGIASALLAGLALALAMLARPNVALTWPLLLGIAAMHQLSNAPAGAKEGIRDWLYQLEMRSLIRWALVSAGPPLLAIASLLWYNQIRFENPLDFGYLTENVAEKLVPDLRRYGQFHLHYLPKNLWAMWLAGPQWNDETNFWQADGEGMSLLLTTPALIYLGRAQLRTPLALGGWVALALLLIPLLLYYNTGWWQFGYRFSLDFMTPILVLLAVAAGRQLSARFRFLILAGVVVNLYGVIWWHWT